MFGGLGKAGWATILVTGGLMLGTSISAQAADLGSDCCTDLEERVAELEATTARKGNRKVKLEVSGHVNEAFLWWDDGVESNAGVYTNDNARTRFRFKGDAKISDDVKAGFLLEVGVRSANSKRFDQNDVNGCNTPAPAQTNVFPSCGLDLRHSVWYIDSKKFGRIWVGLTGGAGEFVTEVNLAATKDILKYSDIEDTGLGLFTRAAGGIELANRSSTSGRTGLEWRQLIRGGGDQPGEGRRFNMIRYDTPEIFGFVGTVDFGEDDTWEVGLRYTEDKFHGFKVAAAIAYGENTEGPIDAFNADPQPGFQCLGNNLSGTTVTPSLADTKCAQLGGSISVMHEKSGIYGNFAAGYMQDDALKTDPGFQAGAVADDRSSFYAFELGVERKWAHLEHLGKTTVFGQYYHNEGGSQDRTVTTVTPGAGWNDVTATTGNDPASGNQFENGDIQSSTLRSYGLGVIQSIDKAAMHVYVVYRHYEGDIRTTGTVDNGFAGTNFKLDDLDVAMSGAIIKF